MSLDDRRVRKYLPFGAAIALAFVVVIIDGLFDAAPGATYALAGFFAGLLIVAGPLVAFGVKTLKSGDPMKAQVPAVPADSGDNGDTSPKQDAALISEGLQEGLLAREYPVCIPADGARDLWIEGVEDSLEPLGVHGTPA